MPCDPRLNTLNPPAALPIPGLPGIPISPFQLPLSGINIPTGLLETVQDFINSLQMQIPGGTLKAIPDAALKTAFDAISKVLSAFAPYLSIYNFFLAAFNLIVCIIEVLCAIPNPFKIASALQKLFATCLPPFLALFPWAALIAMIIAFLLLIIALVEYIINYIKGMINEIIRNLKILGNALSLQDADATLAATTKIAQMFCLIENLLSIFLAISAIIAIINSLATLAGQIPCDDSSAEGCCSPDICPPFIKNNPTGITETTGRLYYNNQVGIDFSLPFFEGLPGAASILGNIVPRKERWQLINTSLTSTYKFSDIITTASPTLRNIFWPEGTSFDGYTSSAQAPYTVDLKLTVNPNTYGITDIRGSRKFVIKNCSVIEKPYNGKLNFDGRSNDFINGFQGVLSIAGGEVYEADGTTPYIVAGKIASIATFIHRSNTSGFPSSDDTDVFNDVEYTWKANHPVLMGYSLITAGCLPGVSAEKAVQAAILTASDLRAVVEKLNPTPAGDVVPSTGFMPNVSGAFECVMNALTSFRSNVSLENAAIFQSAMQTCLGDLQNQTAATYCDALTKGANQFTSVLSASPSLQFISRPVKLSVVLKDYAGNVLSQSIPATCQDSIAEMLEAQVTLGEASKFTYNDDGSFTSNITSNTPGSGTATVLFNGAVLSTIIPGSATTTTTLIENVIPYTFIDSSGAGQVRRDVTDVPES